MGKKPNFHVIFLIDRLLPSIRFTEAMNNPPSYIIVFLIATIIVIVAVLALLVLLILFNQKRQRSFIQSMETLKMNHEKQLLKTQVEIQEQTFRNISQEIHDNINLSLTLAKLNLYMLEDDEKVKASDAVNRSIGLIGNAITDLTAISRGLNSEVICQVGLIAALQQEVDRIGRNTRLKIHMVVGGEPVYLDSARELFIFRIVQEAFNNIIKHAEATSVELRLHYNCSCVDITVTDNGKGFKKEKLAVKEGTAGLTNMETRTKWFNGNFSLQTAEQAGTQLFITIPYDRKQDN